MLSMDVTVTVSVRVCASRVFGWAMQAEYAAPSQCLPRQPAQRVLPIRVTCEMEQSVQL